MNIKKVNCHKRRIINIYIRGFNVITTNQYSGVQRTFNLFEESSKALFTALIKHYAKDNFTYNISSEDFYHLRCIRYM